jgi:NAD(P)-dependent dehydrogenase (short-subunit alcohol dehydrogenase family)
MMTDEQWQDVIATDLSGPFFVIRSFLSHMMSKRWGRIINISSLAQEGSSGQANYAAAKAGLIGMSKSLAAEVAGRGITVNCVAPGFIETAMTDKLATEQRARLGAAIPMGRFGAPADVAAAIAYLASAEAGYVTGQTLHVNGGMAMV